MIESHLAFIPSCLIGNKARQPSINNSLIQDSDKASDPNITLFCSTSTLDNLI